MRPPSSIVVRSDTLCASLYGALTHSDGQNDVAKRRQQLLDIAFKHVLAADNDGKPRAKMARVVETGSESSALSGDEMRDALLSMLLKPEIVDFVISSFDAMSVFAFAQSILHFSRPGKHRLGDEPLLKSTLDILISSIVNSDKVQRGTLTNKRKTTKPLAGVRHDRLASARRRFFDVCWHLYRDVTVDVISDRAMASIVVHCPTVIENDVCDMLLPTSAFDTPTLPESNGKDSEQIASRLGNNPLKIPVPENNDAGNESIASRLGSNQVPENNSTPLRNHTSTRNRYDYSRLLRLCGSSGIVAWHVVIIMCSVLNESKCNRRVFDVFRRFVESLRKTMPLTKFAFLFPPDIRPLVNLLLTPSGLLPEPFRAAHCIQIARCIVRCGRDDVHLVRVVLTVFYDWYERMLQLTLKEKFVEPDWLLILIGDSQVPFTFF